MCLTGLAPYATGLVHCDQALGEEIRHPLARLQWSRWHGNVYKALHKIDAIAALIDHFEDPSPQVKKLDKTVPEFRTDMENNGGFIVHDGERWRDGDGLRGVDGESGGEEA